MGIVYWPRESGTSHGGSGMWRDLLREEIERALALYYRLGCHLL
jgi:hypothetical protein